MSSILSKGLFFDPILALTREESEPLIQIALSFPLHAAGIIVLLIIGLFIGWKIYPYTIGGFEAFATSALGHINARIGTAVFGGALGAGLGVYLFMAKIGSMSEKEAAAMKDQIALG
jgi:hypothetical protein